MRSLLALLALLVPAAAGAQALAYQDVLSPNPRLGYAPVEIAAAPPPAQPSPSPPEARPPARAALVHGFYGDRLEIAPRTGGYGWDVSGEIGSAAHRLWLATAGDGLLNGGVGYVEGQALYSHPLLDAGLALQAGVRRDFVSPRRTYAVLGLQGNLTAPFYVGAFAFLSTKGELTGRLFAYYDWEMRPRLVLQPYAGAELAARDVPALGLGAGVSSGELGLRLRYRLAEPFSPYVGLSWSRLLGRTARIARDAGDDLGGAELVLGVRSYF